MAKFIVENSQSVAKDRKWPKFLKLLEMSHIALNHKRSHLVKISKLLNVLNFKTPKVVEWWKCQISKTLSFKYMYTKKITMTIVVKKWSKFELGQSGPNLTKYQNGTN